jgi:hypothetical protein
MNDSLLKIWLDFTLDPKADGWDISRTVVLGGEASLRFASFLGTPKIYLKSFPVIHFLVTLFFPSIVIKSATMS